MSKIWVICWEWHDKSGNGVVRAYTQEAHAQRDIEMLLAIENSRVLWLVEVDLEEQP